MAAQSLVRHWQVWFDSNADHLAALNQPHTAFSPLKRAAVICVAVAPERLKRFYYENKK